MLASSPDEKAEGWDVFNEEGLKMCIFPLKL